MRSRSNGGVIGAYALPTQNYANGVFFIHDAAIYNTGPNPIWPLGAGYIYSATGGTISTAVDNGNYKVHTFTANGTFTVATGASQLEILIVGGGGPGGQAYAVSADSAVGGGGGGGGVTVVSTWVNPGTTFTVEVAGPRSLGSGAAQIPGNPSKVTSTAGHNYVSLGGVVGGGSLFNGGYTGGSGGGAGETWYSASRSGGSSTPGQGYDGGAGAYVAVNSLAAGGGGGAAMKGYDAVIPRTSTSSHGGDGYLWSRTGYYYGAGGGGAYLASGATSVPAGLSGGGVTNQGVGAGYSTTATGHSNGGSVSSTHYFGVGGGGGALYNSTGAGLGGDGGPGTVIFCYRYK